MAGNKNLHSAKNAKNDEFYTQLIDIENELKHYREHFKNKVVYCNCDDPFESNFFKYFAMNFNVLGLKKLICTCYSGSNITGTEFDLFHQDISISNEKAYKIEIDHVEDENGDGAVDLQDVELMLKNKYGVSELKGDGDFRSDECVELLKESDIVVTNPPFSLFREYVAQLFEYDKKFLIIGNQNAISYKEIFPYIKDNKMWTGYKCGHTLFAVPSYYEIPDFYDKTDTKKLRSNGYIIDKNGKLWRNLGNICWFTNLDIAKRHEDIFLVEEYSPEKYPKYDNYDAIEVSKVVNIPKEYFEPMGVPISFLDKYNPDQFELIKFRKGDDNKDLCINGKCPYFRIIIKRKNC